MDGLSGLLYFAKDPLFALEEARRLHGPWIGYRAGGNEVRWVFEPELVEALLLTNSEHLIKDEFTRGLRPIVGNGLLTNEGKPWKAQRKLLAPSFQPKHIQGYAGVMVDSAASFVRKVSQDGVRPIHDDMMAITLDVVVRALFGGTTDRTEEVGRLVEQAMEDYRRLFMSFRVAFPAWFPFVSRLRLGRVRRALRQVIEDLISARRKRELDTDMISRLILARDDEGRGMSQEQLLDEALTMLIAGHETTALALTYSLSLLCDHPAEMAELEREIEQVIGGRPARLEDVGELKFTRAVVRESLRLYPPAWAMGREVTSEFSLLGETQKVGTRFTLSPWVTHRDERFFPEPLAFRPARWLTGETESLPKYAYLPFGAGPRVCIGNHFAEMEAMLVLVTLLQGLRFAKSADAPLTLAPSVTLRPKGAVPLRVTPRSP